MEYLRLAGFIFLTLLFAFIALAGMVAAASGFAYFVGLLAGESGSLLEAALLLFGGLVVCSLGTAAVIKMLTVRL